MSKRSRIVGFCLAALVLGSIVVLASRSRDPRYGGRTLTAWLKITRMRHWMKYSAGPGARRRFGRSGLEVHTTPAEDGRGAGWSNSELDNPKKREVELPALEAQGTAMAQLLGIAGFEALGTNCAAAVPELARLMQDTNHTFTALRCLVDIGAPAETPICQALTNRSPQIRAFAASQLAWVTDDIESTSLGSKGL